MHYWRKSFANRWEKFWFKRSHNSTFDGKFSSQKRTRIHTNWFLVPRFRDPFGQHQEIKRIADSGDENVEILATNDDECTSAHSDGRLLWKPRPQSNLSNKSRTSRGKEDKRREAEKWRRQGKQYKRWKRWEVEIAQFPARNSPVSVSYLHSSLCVFAL